jgi:hypothetical protein
MENRMALSVPEAFEQLARLPQCYLFLTVSGQQKGRYRVGRLTVAPRGEIHPSFYEVGARAPCFQVRDLSGWEVTQDEPLVINKSGEPEARAKFYSKLPPIDPLLTSHNLHNYLGKLVRIYARDPRRGVIESQIGQLVQRTEPPSRTSLWWLSNPDGILTHELKTEDVYGVALVDETDLG